MPGAGEEILRMPLNRKKELVGRRPLGERLGDSVRRERRDDETGGEPPDRLVVATVDHRVPAGEAAPKRRRRGSVADQHLVSLEVLLLELVPNTTLAPLRGNVLDQGSPPLDVDELHPPADREKGKGEEPRLLAGGELPSVAERLDLDVVVPARLAVVGRIDVVAATEKESGGSAQRFAQRDRIVRDMEQLGESRAGRQQRTNVVVLRPGKIERQADSHPDIVPIRGRKTPEGLRDTSRPTGGNG